MTFQIKRWLIHPKVWKFVCFASTVVGLVSYALSSSFNLLFGDWNLLKIFFYTVFSSIICLAVQFAKVWQYLNSRSLMCKAHLSVVVLTATTMYSFFYDKAVNRKPDAYSHISCASFAIMSLSLLRQTHLGLQPGEALAVNFAFVLHRVPDESVNTQNHRDRLLRLVKSLSPKVVTFVDLECNTNNVEFFPRFLETLDYSTAIFESIDLSLLRDNKERIIVEHCLLGKDVVNTIACEGDERVERHELLEKWRPRFAMVGFTPYPFSSSVNDNIKKLLKNYSDNYRVKERDGALYLGWKDRDLIASSAWKCDSLKLTSGGTN